MQTLYQHSINEALEKKIKELEERILKLEMRDKKHSSKKAVVDVEEDKNEE